MTGCSQGALKIWVLVADFGHQGAEVSWVAQDLAVGGSLGRSSAKYSRVACPGRGRGLTFMPWLATQAPQVLAHQLPRALMGTMPTGRLSRFSSEDGLAHDAVYSGAELTNRTPPEFVVDAVMAMAEIAKWEKVGYTVWVRDDSGFEHPLTPAIRGLRPPV